VQFSFLMLRSESMRSVLIFLFCLIGISVYAGDPTPKAGLNKNLILQLLNAVRQKGCTCDDTRYPAAPPLTWNDLLEKAAAGHSTEMVQRKYFSHTSTDGYNAGDRLTKVGYAWKTYGENIGMGYRDEKEMVEGWLKSPGHCKNIMNPLFKEVGVARVGDYWTQDFGTR